MVAPDEAGDLSRSLVRVPGSGSDRSLTPVTCDLGRVSSLAATVPINPRLPDIITKPRNVPALPKPLPTTEAEATTNKLGSQQGGPMRHARTRPAPYQPYQVNRKAGEQAPQIPTPSPTQGSTPTTIPFPTIPPPPTVEVPANFMANRQGRIVYLTTQGVMNRASNILHVNTSAGPALFMPVHTESTKLHRTNLVTQPPMQTRPAAEQGSAAQDSTGLTVMTLEQLMRQQNSLRLENAELHKQISRYRKLFKNPDMLVAVIRKLGIRIDPN